MEGLERIIAEHPFFAGLGDRYCSLVCGCAENMRFEADQYLFHEGQLADRFYLIRHGHVALEFTLPGRGTVTYQTLAAGDIVGISWLIPPYRSMSDARAMDLVRAIGIDAACLRRKCEADHDLGYDFMKRVVPILVQRLHATRLQVLDVYGAPA